MMPAGRWFVFVGTIAEVTDVVERREANGWRVVSREVVDGPLYWEVSWAAHHGPYMRVLLERSRATRSRRILRRVCDVLRHLRGAVIAG